MGFTNQKKMPSCFNDKIPSETCIMVKLYDHKVGPHPRLKYRTVRDAIRLFSTLHTLFCQMKESTKLYTKALFVDGRGDAKKAKELRIMIQNKYQNELEFILLPHCNKIMRGIAYCLRSCDLLIDSIIEKENRSEVLEIFAEAEITEDDFNMLEEFTFDHLKIAMEDTMNFKKHLEKKIKDLKQMKGKFIIDLCDLCYSSK